MECFPYAVTAAVQHIWLSYYRAEVHSRIVACSSLFHSLLVRQLTISISLTSFDLWVFKAVRGVYPCLLFLQGRLVASTQIIPFFIFLKHGLAGYFLSAQASVKRRADSTKARILRLNKVCVISHDVGFGTWNGSIILPHLNLDDNNVISSSCSLFGSIYRLWGPVWGPFHRLARLDWRNWLWRSTKTVVQQLFHCSPMWRRNVVTPFCLF